MDALAFHADECRLEENFWKLVGFLQISVASSLAELLVVVHGDVAELLLDITDGLLLGGGGESETTLHENFHHVLSQVAARQVHTADGVRQGETLVDRNGVADTISGVHDDTSGSAGGVQGEHGLDLNVHGWHVEGLEHDLRHALTVGLWVQRSL